MSYAHWKPVSSLEAADGQQKRSSGIKLSWVCIMILPLFGQETLENHHLWVPVSSSSKQVQKSQSHKVSVRVNAVPRVKDLIPSKHSVKIVFSFACTKYVSILDVIASHTFPDQPCLLYERLILICFINNV